MILPSAPVLAARLYVTPAAQPPAHRVAAVGSPAPAESIHLRRQKLGRFIRIVRLENLIQRAVLPPPKDPAAEYDPLRGPRPNAIRPAEFGSFMG